MKHAHMGSSARRTRWIWTAVLVLALTAGCAKQRIYTTPPGSEGAVEETTPGGSDESGVTAVPESAPAQRPAAENGALVSEDLPEPAAAPAKTATPAPAPAPATKTPATVAPAAAAPAAAAPAPKTTPAPAQTAIPAAAAARSSAQDIQAAQAASYDERGLAARITPDSEDLPTASGDLYDPQAFTAAHRTLPLGTSVRVTNLANGRSTTVRINDRGPFDKTRVIDLSQAAAEAIGLGAQATTEVGIAQVGGPAKAKAAAPAPAKTAAAPIPAPAKTEAAPAPAKTEAAQASAPAKAEAAPVVTAATETPIHPAPDAVQAVSGGYWVQVGAFTDKANAERALEGLVRDGYVQSRLVVAPGSGLFRVQAGTFPGEADAQSALARLKGTYPASFLVRD